MASPPSDPFGAWLFKIGLVLIAVELFAIFVLLAYAIKWAAQ